MCFFDEHKNIKQGLPVPAGILIVSLTLALAVEFGICLVVAPPMVLAQNSSQTNLISSAASDQSATTAVDTPLRSSVVTADSKLLVFSRFETVSKVAFCSGFRLLLKDSFSRILRSSSCRLRLGM